MGLSTGKHFSNAAAAETLPYPTGSTLILLILQSDPPLCSLTRAAVPQCHRPGSFTEMRSLTALGAGSAGSWPARPVPPEVVRETVPCFSPLLGSDGSLAVFGVPWLVAVSPQFLPLSSPGVLPVRLCPGRPFIRTPVRSDQSPTLLGHDSTLAHTSTVTPSPNKVTF